MNRKSGLKSICSIRDHATGGFGRKRREMPTNHPQPWIYRLPWLDQTAGDADPLVREPQVAMVEAILMLADEPLPARKIASCAGLAGAGEARRVIDKLMKLYDNDGTAFQVAEIAGGFQLFTRPVYHPWLDRLRKAHDDVKLSSAALETLAVIAYRQPIMRAEIENIRGVHCGELLSQLMEKGLVKITGRHDSLGRPVLYGTTKKFLQSFGLNSLKDLPEVQRLKS